MSYLTYLCPLFLICALSLAVQAQNSGTGSTTTKGAVYDASETSKNIVALFSNANDLVEAYFVARLGPGKEPIALTEEELSRRIVLDALKVASSKPRIATGNYKKIAAYNDAIIRKEQKALRKYALAELMEEKARLVSQAGQYIYQKGRATELKTCVSDTSLASYQKVRSRLDHLGNSHAKRERSSGAYDSAEALRNIVALFEKANELLEVHLKERSKSENTSTDTREELVRKISLEQLKTDRFNLPFSMKEVRQKRILAIEKALVHDDQEALRKIARERLLESKNAQLSSIGFQLYAAIPFRDLDLTMASSYRFSFAQILAQLHVLDETD